MDKQSVEPMAEGSQVAEGGAETVVVKRMVSTRMA
jgi:hypothetical protein